MCIERSMRIVVMWDMNGKVDNVAGKWSVVEVDKCLIDV